jgi:hypothetical protein
MTVEDRILKELKKRGGMTNAELRDALFKGKGVGPHGDSYIPELDMALQKLRKAGGIRYANRKWERADRKVCPRCKGAGYLD